MGLEADGVEQWHLDAIADADPYPFWLVEGDAPESNKTLVRAEHCDLCVVGGGYTGLWTAIVAKEREPTRDVVLIEAKEIGSAASGRNGGFVDSSLTHGLANALERWPKEAELLERLGLENLDAIEEAIETYGIKCGFQRTAEINVVTTSHPVSYFDDLRESYESRLSFGHETQWLDEDAVRARINSPTYLSGVANEVGRALVDPAKLAWGLKAAAEQLGVRIYEDSKAIGLERTESGVLVETPLGSVKAERVALATNAFKPLLKRMSRFIAPVYDYCMVTEPLSAEQMAAIGWQGREGVSDMANQFHYYRLTDDNRIIWGGYDAIYYWGGGVSIEHESRPETWARLSANFFATFPQLEGIGFSHVWGGAIDTSTRFSVFWGTALKGRVGYALGYTGLGVAASRFGAAVMLDLLDGRQSAATRTDFVRSKPIPFPPEPFRFMGIQTTRWSLDREDRTGKRNLWLRSLDRLGLGFDS